MLRIWQALLYPALHKHQRYSQAGRCYQINIDQVAKTGSNFETKWLTVFAVLDSSTYELSFYEDWVSKNSFQFCCQIGNNFCGDQTILLHDDQIRIGISRPGYNKVYKSWRLKSEI